MKHFTDQEIQDVINKAPKFIKDEVSSGEDTAAIIVQIGQKYKLHIDQIGVLAELNRNMLLGLVGPEEFLKELIAMGISDKDAREIMTEINQKIFVPLREKMRSGMTTVQQPAKPTEPVKPAAPPAVWGASVPPVPRPPQINASVPSYSSPLQSPKYFHLENKIHPLPIKTMEGAVPIINEKLLEDREEPHINIGVSDKVQGVNLPGTRPPILVPLKPNPLPLAPSTKPIPPSVSIPSRPYSTDPYREPLE